MKKDCKKYKGCAVKTTGQFCLDDCVIYDKQDETVSGKARMTEEEAKDFLLKAHLVMSKNDLKICIDNLKFSGYILPDPMEETEEIFEQIGLITNNCTGEERITLVWQDAKKIYEAYSRMKPYYEKHKGEKI